MAEMSIETLYGLLASRFDGVDDRITELRVDYKALSETVSALTVETRQNTSFNSMQKWLQGGFLMILFSCIVGATATLFHLSVSSAAVTTTTSTPYPYAGRR